MKLLPYLLILLLVLRFCSPVEACERSVKLTSGQAAPCTGWLVSEPKMQEILKDGESLDLHKKLQLQQEHLRKLDLQEIEFYKLQSKENVKALNKSETQKFWSNIGFFALGVVMTGIAAKAAIESTK